MGSICEDSTAVCQNEEPFPVDTRCSSRTSRMHTWRNTRHREKGDLIPLGVLIFARRKFPSHCQNLINPTTYCNNSRVAPPTVKIGRTICQPFGSPYRHFSQPPICRRRQNFYKWLLWHNYEIFPIIFFFSFARDYFCRYKFKIKSKTNVVAKQNKQCNKFILLQSLCI